MTLGKCPVEAVDSIGLFRGKPRMPHVRTNVWNHSHGPPLPQT
jgi:hypothetical protein